MARAQVREPEPKGFFKRNFTWIDVFKMGLSLAAGYGLKTLFGENPGIAAGILALVIVAAGGVIALDRLRASSEADITRELNAARDHVIDHIDELQRKLAKQLDHVHAAVRFIPDIGPVSGKSQNARPGYDTATTAVRGAERRIFVLGDYSPPGGEGATLDRPPEHRSDYLRAIEEMLKDRLESGAAAVEPLTYHRFIQRPTEIYEEIKKRESSRQAAGVVLRRYDMDGDMQAFDHCARILEIARGAAGRRSDRIDVQIRLIPFLPNCPSILLVDDRELQFTIPTRIDHPGDGYARQGLHGVLAMEDRARGTLLCTHFENVFRRLETLSLPVIKVDNLDRSSVSNP